MELYVSNDKSVIKMKFNKSARLSLINNDMLSQEMIATGKGFRVTEKGKSDIDEEPGLYSIHSKLFGSDWGDKDAFEDRCSCRCGHINGKNNEGLICPDCNTPVEEIDIDMNITGWITLDNDYIIHPNFYLMIKSFIGKDLNYILRYDETQDEENTDIQEDSEPEEEPDDEIAVRARKPSPFDGIGLIEFKNRFEEIMKYYLKKNKKLDAYLFILSHKGKVFTKNIPVFSSFLRPFIIKGQEIKYTDEDTVYKQLFTNSELLNNRFELEKRIRMRKNRMKKSKNKNLNALRRQNILFTIQKDVNELWDLVFETINGKTGQIKENITGGRMNYTARNVIIPDPILRADEIGLGYTTFLELFKLEIIGLLSKMNNITLNEAHEKWRRATISFSNSMYELMLYMIETDYKIVEIGRNPSIDYGSQLVMRVVKINKSMSCYTLSLPLSVIQLFNADFDGDIMHEKSQKIITDAVKYLVHLRPSNNIYISRNDGKLNTKASLYKDQAAGLNAFANI